MKISENFELEEFLVSETAGRLGRKLEPPQEIIDNLTSLCLTLLEPIRMELGRPIIINSGWRPLWLNRMIHSSDSSDHVIGGAADIRIRGMTPTEAAKAIQALNLPVRQVINEYGAWVHIAKPRVGEAPRNEYLTASRVGAKTVYNPGILEVA